MIVCGRCYASPSKRYHMYYTVEGREVALVPLTSTRLQESCSRPKGCDTASHVKG